MADVSELGHVLTTVPVYTGEDGTHFIRLRDGESILADDTCWVTMSKDGVTDYELLIERKDRNQFYVDEGQFAADMSQFARQLQE